MTTEKLYKIFGVPATCTDEELHKAFLARIFEIHPDRNVDRVQDATRRAQTLTSTYTELKGLRAKLSNRVAHAYHPSKEVYFTEEIEGIQFTVLLSESFGVNLQDIKERRNRFRETWEDFQRNKSDPLQALLLIHAAFEAGRFDSVRSLLVDHSLIDLASLLLTHVDARSACHTLISWADLLWSAKRGREAVQILEDVVDSGRAQTIENGLSITLLNIPGGLRRFHYRWAQYVDPVTGVKPTPKVRIFHLNRVVELGFRFGYIFKFLAEAYHDLGDDEQALAYLTQAWQIDPNLSGAVRISKALGLSKSEDNE
jgi:hypothetical protein